MIKIQKNRYYYLYIKLIIIIIKILNKLTPKNKNLIYK